MRQLTLATGTNRKQKARWKNTKIEWKALVQRLSHTCRTPETMAAFLNLPKEKQDEIKDIGGFVAGELKGGRRTANSVNFRDIITLDADNIPENVDIWDIYTMFNDNAALVYSTHKHQKTAPRLRLLIPLDRSVSPEEYEAISRKVAEQIGIDYFDDSTYQPNRLMYWPSTPLNGTYVFEHQDGEPLCADEILKLYYDWHDVTTWPTSSRCSIKNIDNKAKEQEDPLLKDNIIGCFCRAYTIEEAIAEFLQHVYAPAISTENESRYTYIKGSASCGLIVYDHKFAYSHHGTDPISGQLVNAFDLVRIHLYSKEDERTLTDLPPTKMPSYKAMSEMVVGLTRVKEQLLSGFDVLNDEAIKPEVLVPTLPDEVNKVVNVGEALGSLASEIEMTKSGAIAETYKNLDILLQRTPQLAGMIGYDEFTDNLLVLKDLPWRPKAYGPLWIDADTIGLIKYFEDKFGLTCKERIRDVVTFTKNSNSRFHPVKQYLDSLPKWDGIKRAETIFIDYLGAEDSKYTREITKMFLAAAVKRIYDPGCKYDYMVVLRGEQGKGKSTLIEKLAKGWYTDSINTFDGKDPMEKIRGNWLIEMAELTAVKRADVETVKQFISKRMDEYRPAYAAHKVRVYRQCVFIGTTNRRVFLQDSTGNRRFLIIETDIKEPTLDIWSDLKPDLIWAEVLTFFKDTALFPSKEIDAVAKKNQDDHFEEAANAGIIRAFLDMKIPTNWDEMDINSRRRYIAERNDPTALLPEGVVIRDKVCAVEVYREAIGGQLKDYNRQIAREINETIERTPGWFPVNCIRFGGEYDRQRGYRRSKLDIILNEHKDDILDFLD